MRDFPETTPSLTDEQKRKAQEVSTCLTDIFDDEVRQMRKLKAKWFAGILYETSRLATARLGQEFPYQSWDDVPDIEKTKLLYQAERILCHCDIDFSE